MTPDECLDHYRETGCVHFFAEVPDDFRRAIQAPEGLGTTAYITITEQFLSAECQALRLDPEELDWFPY